MADVMSILSSSYKSAGLSVPSNTKYVAVDPKLYEGTWSGTYPDKKTFKITVSDVSGFHAQVKYQSGDTVKFQNVLIKDQVVQGRRHQDDAHQQGRDRRRSKTSSPIPLPAPPISTPPSPPGADGFRLWRRSPRRLHPIPKTQYGASALTLSEPESSGRRVRSWCQALRSVARMRVGSPLVRSSVWK